MTLRAAAGSLLLLLAACGTTPKEGEPPRVRIAIVNAPTVPMLPGTLCDRLGHFGEAELRVEIVDLPSGRGVVETLLSGEAEVAMSFPDPVIQLAASGQKIQVFNLLLTSPSTALAISPRSAHRIQRAEQLKGATIGVTGVGGGLHMQVNYFLLRHGLRQTDFSTVNIGTIAARVAALEQGKVDAAVLSEPGITLFESRHPDAKLLADMRTPDGLERTLGARTHPGSALYATAAWLEQNPDTALRVAQAMKRTLEWIHSHTPEEIADRMPRSFQGEDRTLYVDAIRKLQPLFSRDGVMPREGMESILRVLAESDPKVRAATININETFTNAFVQ